jgi:beta-lactamase regulating signal transducer with metallopeptidase domain/Tol biopolymer transport system component
MEALASHLQPFFQWLWQTTVIASLVICLILAAQKSLGGRLGPRWSHALWLVLLIRMVIPWAPPSRISLLNLLPSSVRQAQLPPMANLTEPSEDFHSAAVSATSKATTGQAATPTQSVQKARPPRPQTLAKAERPPEPALLTLRQALPLLWLAGATLIGAYLFVSNFVLWRIVKRDRPLVNQSTLELFEECKVRMGVQTLVAAVPSDRIESPALFGFIRPRLLLPRQMLDTASREEMRYVFLHELAHLKRHDIYLGWIASLLQVLHWFNPLVWFAFHQMRSDRELACDALVLARTGQQESQEYGRAIVALLRRFSRSRPLPAMAGILESKSQLKRRIAMIARFKNNSYRWSPLAVALIAMLCCISLPDGKPGKAAEPSVAKPTGASMSGEQLATPLAGESNIFVDPQTGIRFTKFKTISGPSDVIEGSPGLTLSPNGRFLLWGVQVVPLDGSAPFELVNMPNAGRGSWSPDGRKVVFYAGAMWLIEVDAETGRPAGSARKLLEGDYWAQAAVRWSPDSQRIVFARRDSQIRDQIWTISIANDEASQVTDPFGFGLVSPDGKMVACSEGQGVMNQNSLLVKPVTGQEAKKIKDRVYPVVWSADTEWLVCKPAVGGGWEDVIRFVRVADGREVTVSTPGYLIRQSPQGRKLLFYHGSYDYGTALKVISVAGGPATEFGRPSLSFADTPGSQLWMRDARRLLVEGERGGNWGLWAIPLDGKDPQLLTIDTPVFLQAGFRVLSPDGSKLLLSTIREDKTFDLWVVPISLTQMKSTGPAIKIFGGLVPPTRLFYLYMDAWSPDSSKVAFVHNWDIWVASADGKSVLQLTKTPERDGWPMWSPDGTMIAFFTQPPNAAPLSTRAPASLGVRVVPASGGETKVIADLANAPVGGEARYGWFPNGKEVTVACEEDGIIANFPITGGGPRIVARLKDLGMERVSWVRWSPDGHLLAFEGGTGRRDMKLYVYQPDNAKLQRLSDAVAPFYWSPDNKWISFFSAQIVKTRPEGVLWEMDVEEALAKLAK